MSMSSYRNMARSILEACVVLLSIFASFLRAHGLFHRNVSEARRVQITEGLNAIFAFQPAEIEQLIQDEVAQVYFTVETAALPASAVSQTPLTLQVESLDTGIAKVQGNSDILIYLNTTVNYTFAVKGVFLGRTKLHFSALTDPSNQSGTWTKLDLFYDVAVIREERLIDILFIVFVTIFVIFSNIGMGCKIDLEIVKEVLRRPVSPAIGFFCQFIIMPVLAFSLTKALSLDGGQGLGFFATGCAPAGGASNLYTFMFKADVSLSVTMTLISVTAAFGMVPLWLLTLGQHILNQSEGDIEIPFQNILMSLASLVIPVGIGVLIQKKKPNWAKKIILIIKPFFVIFILFMFTVGVWSNLYLFKLFTWELVIAGLLLPYVGFLLGGLLAFILRQPKIRIIAIAIETGIQNTGVPIILLKYSLPQPEADLSVVGPVITSIFTPIPLWIALAVLEIKSRWCQDKFDEVSTYEKGLDPAETDSNENDTSNGIAAILKDHELQPQSDE